MLLENGASKEISRRGLFRVGWKLLKIAGVISLGGVGLYTWGKATPEAQEIDDEYPFPGCLYASPPALTRPPLINAAKGNAEFYTFYSLYDPIVNEATNECFVDFFQPRKSPRRLGDIFLSQFQICQNILSKSFSQIHADKEHPPSLENTLFLTAITLGATFNINYSLEDLKKIGVDISKINPYNGKPWLGQEYQKALPHIYPVPYTDEDNLTETDKKGRYDGADRAAHAMEQLSMLLVYSHARIYGLSEAVRIPNAARAKVRAQPSLESEIDQLSEDGCEMNELIESADYLSGNTITDENGNKSVSGKWFDPTTPFDLEANRIGKKTAKMLLYDPENKPLAWAQVTAAADYLNKKEFSQPYQAAIIPPITLKSVLQKLFVF